jgi:membrane-bound lytic murein transglycosylase D
MDAQDDYKQACFLAKRAQYLWENGMNGTDVIAAAGAAEQAAGAKHKTQGRKQYSLLPALFLVLALRCGASAVPLIAAELPPGTDAAPVMGMPEPVSQNMASPAAFLLNTENSPVSIERPLRTKMTALPARLETYRQEKRILTEAEAPGNSPRGVVLQNEELPGLDQPLTQRYIQRYTERGLRKWLVSTLKAGEPYLAFIRAEIERRGLPPYLLYLPVIESGFIPSALSKSGASGLWQFMRNSIKPYLRITEWIDERRDFYKSTFAALSKLESHYREFGDWYLALAAYNSGGGAIASAIRQTGIHDYWELNSRNKLKKETSVYVPKLLAVYYIASNPRRFGLDIDWSNEVYEWELVPVRRQVDITVLAEEAGMGHDALRAFNRELLFNITPPRQADGKDYELKVRKEQAAAVRAVLEQDNLPLIRTYIHVIREGDTLSMLALHYGVSVDTIITSNPGVKPAALQLGYRLLIPAVKDVTGPPPPRRLAEKQTPARQPASQPAGTHTIKIWRVEKGDTLYSIARQTGVTVDAITAKNGMSANEILKIGRILELP